MANREKLKGGDPISTQPAAGSERIEFVAAVSRVRTLADGGLRFEFDVSEDATMQAAQLMECKRFSAALLITAEPIKDALTEFDDETEEGTKRSGPGVGRRRSTNRRDKRTGG